LTKLSALIGKQAFIWSLVAAGHTPAAAKVFEDGVRAWAAFECAAYAHVASHDPLNILKPHEERRLFQLGTKLARRFAARIRSGKYKKDDVPDVLSRSLHGPSIDFIAGRLAENAQRAAMEKLPKQKVTLNWTAKSGEKALDNFLQGNCRAIY